MINEITSPANPPHGCELADQCVFDRRCPHLRSCEQAVEPDQAERERLAFLAGRLYERQLLADDTAVWHAPWAPRPRQTRAQRILAELREMDAWASTHPRTVGEWPDVITARPGSGLPPAGDRR